MKNYQRLLAFMLAIMLLLSAFSFTASAEDTASDSVNLNLEAVPDKKAPYASKSEIELDVEYNVTVPQSSADEACYLTFKLKDSRFYYYTLSATNINMPTEDGLVNVQVLDNDYNPVCGVGMAEGYTNSVNQKLDGYSGYYIKIFSEDTSAFNGGKLSFKLSSLSDPEYDSGTGRWTDKEAYEGSLVVPEDVDIVGFYVSGTTDYRFTVQTKNNPKAELEVEVYSEGGMFMGSATTDESGKAVVDITALNEDHYGYFVHIRSSNGEMCDYIVKADHQKYITKVSDFPTWKNVKITASNDEPKNIAYIQLTTLSESAGYRVYFDNFDIKTNPASADEQLQVELLDENFEYIQKLAAVEEDGQAIVYPELEPDTVYYFKVYNGNPLDTEGGYFRVGVVTDTDQDKGQQAYAVELKLGDTASGEVATSSDKDWFKVKTNDSTKYILCLENKSEETISYDTIRAEVLTEDGEQLGIIITLGEDKDFLKIDLEPNTIYYIKVHDPGMSTAEYDVFLAERLILGDTNLDDNVKIQDATLIQKYLAKLAELDEKQNTLADVTGDGKVNIKDATAIQKYLAKIETPYNIGGYIL